MEATLQSVIPVKRILHNREPPEHSMPETTLQPANPAKRSQLLDWLKSGIHKSEKNCPQRVSLCSTSQTCCRIFNVFFFSLTYMSWTEKLKVVKTIFPSRKSRHSFPPLVSPRFFSS